MDKKIEEKIKELNKKYSEYWSIEINCSNTSFRCSLYCGNWDYERRHFASVGSLINEMDRILETTDEKLYKRIRKNLEDEISEMKTQLEDKEDRLKQTHAHQLKTNH